MASWLGQLLNPFRGNGEPALSLGAFGKHPGWNDHIEDFGLDTDALLTARQLLYVQGIGGLIDSAAWDKMAPDEVLPDFGHLAAWFGDADLVVARLWASKDGKGRARYPMVICAHAAHVNPAAILPGILPAFQTAENNCRDAATADQVQCILESLRNNLRGLLPTAAAANGSASSASHATVARLLGLTPTSDAWTRVLYSAENQLTSFTNAKIPDAQKRITMKLQSLSVLAQQLRLPTDEANFADVALFWRDLIYKIVGGSIPLLFLQPLGQPWIDVIVGCPGVKQLVCLKATAKGIPPLQDIPYNLPQEFRDKAAQTFQEFCA